MLRGAETLGTHFHRKLRTPQAVRTRMPPLMKDIAQRENNSLFAAGAGEWLEPGEVGESE